MERYVNMADIIRTEDPERRLVALVELLFFAYRDFVSDPDQLLEELGFGRAHHRVLHFVGRDPGMTVAQLLDILRITKQSLGRVLKDLIDKGYIYQREGEQDRRQRLLHLTEQGAALHQQLMAPQIERFREALKHTEGLNEELLQSTLLNLASPANRKEISEWIARASGAETDDQ